MAEKNYTAKFKEALAQAIRDHIAKKKLKKALVVKTEYSVKLLNGTVSIIDIAVLNELDRGLPDFPNRVFGIEIEVLSNQSYIETNYEKFKTYVEEKDSRIGALIQLFTNKTNISSQKYQQIFEKSLSDIYEVKGFFYAMRDFEFEDERAYKQKALEVLSNLKFKRVLNKFIKLTHSVEYK